VVLHLKRKRMISRIEKTFSRFMIGDLSGPVFITLPFPRENLPETSCSLGRFFRSSRTLDYYFRQFSIPPFCYTLSVYVTAFRFFLLYEASTLLFSSDLELFYTGNRGGVSVFPFPAYALMDRGLLSF